MHSTYSSNLWSFANLLKPSFSNLPTVSKWPGTFSRLSFGIHAFAAARPTQSPPSVSSCAPPSENRKPVIISSKINNAP